MGLIATMAALVLGLLTASAQSYYASRNADLQKIASDVVEISRFLAYFGPEAAMAQNLLREALVTTHDRVWSDHGMQPENVDPLKMRSQADQFYETLQSLAPKTDAQRFARSRALELTADIVHTRLLMFEQSGSSVSWPFVAVLVFWLSVLFLGFGLFAPLHATIVCTMLIGALSVSAAMFLILELNEPYSGLGRLSDTPLLRALTEIGGEAQR